MASGCVQRNPHSAPWQMNVRSFQIQSESATKQFRAKTHAVRRSRHFCRIFHPIRFRPLRIRINSLSKVSENSEQGREGTQTTARSVSVVFADLTKMMNRIRQRLGPAVRKVKPVLEWSSPSSIHLNIGRQKSFTHNSNLCILRIRSVLQRALRRIYP